LPFVDKLTASNIDISKHAEGNKIFSSTFISLYSWNKTPLTKKKKKYQMNKRKTVLLMHAVHTM
jgi:hypothetical protein